MKPSRVRGRPLACVWAAQEGEQGVGTGGVVEVEVEDEAWVWMWVSWTWCSKATLTRPVEWRAASPGKVVSMDFLNEVRVLF